MKQILHVLRDPALDGPTNMGRDEHLLYSDNLRPAAVRIYAWDPPTISLGYFQRYAEVARLPAEVRALAVVRRPTGGGAILHDQEVTYCLVVDDSLDVGRLAPLALYRLVHTCWRDALGAGGARSAGRIQLAPDSFPMPTPRTGPFFCFEQAGCTDLVLAAGAGVVSEQSRATKVLGSAQRRIPGRVLQHGSLLLGRRFRAHPGADLGESRAEVIEAWIGEFLDRLAAALQLTLHETAWTAAQLADVERRRAVYASEEWLRKR